MSHRIKMGIFAVIGLLLTASFYGIYAQGNPPPENPGAVTLEDLGVESVGLLPTNPFYFMKEFGRGIRKFFTFNPARKAELELTIVNEKAAELKKLENINPQNIEALKLAAANYQNSVARLQQRLTELETTSENPNVNRLLNSLLERAWKHQQLFDDLQSRFAADEELNEILNFLHGKVSETLAIVPENLESAELFRERLENLIASEEGKFKNFRAAEILDRLEEKLEGKSRDEILKLKENLLLDFSGRLEGGLDISGLKEVSGDRLLRLKILDEVRDRLLNADLKTQINIYRQQFLREVKETSGISEKQAGEAIDAAQRLIADLEKAIGDLEGGVPTSVNELLKRAKFNVEQAELLFGESNFGGAFGQAIAASAAVKNALTQISLLGGDFSDDLSDLKADIDELSRKARERGLIGGEPNRIVQLISEAEKRIAQLSDMVKSGAEPAKVIPLLRGTKLLVSMIGELLENESRTNP